MDITQLGTSALQLSVRKLSASEATTPTQITEEMRLSADKEELIVISPEARAMALVDKEKFPLLGKDIKVSPIGIHTMGIAQFNLVTGAEIKRHQKDGKVSGSVGGIEGRLEQFEIIAMNEMDMPNAVSLISSVKSALLEGGNTFTSIDSVMQFNYLNETARETINYLDVPEHLASSLQNLLDENISNQQYNQTLSISKTKSYIGSQWSKEAKESYEKLTAAMELNEYLQSSPFSLTEPTVTGSENILRTYLTNNTELVVFSMNNLSDMFDYYEQGFKEHMKIVNLNLSNAIKYNKA